MKVKKVVFTLNVDNYLPDLTEITLPYLKGWADKIEADFHVISERKFPDMPVTYEKFQIWDLAHGEFADRDWFIYLDLDALIHPDCADFTAALPKDTTCSHGTDFTPNRFRPDKYFLRDGRFFGKGNWCAIFSDWCLDYYHPLDDITLAEAVSNIFPTQDERNFGITAEHLIDDWLVSRNISRYGLDAPLSLPAKMEMSLAFRGFARLELHHGGRRKRAGFNAARQVGYGPGTGTAHH